MSTGIVRIASRFCGPPGMGNGGYVCGLVAGELAGPVEVTLRLPAPLERELVREEFDEARATLSTPEGELVAEGSVLPSLEVQLPEHASFEAAEAASRGFIGFSRHPYPGCFVCGTHRSESSPGLALFPGAVGDARVAAPFRPARDLCDAAGLLRREQVWAALDCPSWFGYAAFHDDVKGVLLGRLAVAVERRPAADERCVVQGFAFGREGRRILCGSALYGAYGDVLAYARATWVELKPSARAG